MSHRSRSPVLADSPITPAAFGVAPGSLFGALTANPDVRTANETLGSMKSQLDMLGQVFESLGKQTTQMVNLGGEFETAQHLNKVRKEMDESDRKQEAQIEEIKVLLENVLQREIVERLRVIIEAGVLDTIDEVVKEQVKAELPRVIPKSLQDEVSVHRKQLQEVQRALHNSESRRANSLLRTSKLTEDLHTIYKADGTISLLFPRNLQSLFNMDAGNAAQLLQDYDMLDVTQSRERNLNRFMQFCGVTYQLVLPTKGPSVPQKI